MADQLAVGNATFLIRELGVGRPCWNLEAACASSIVGFHTACGLIQAGQYRNILVVASSTCSRISDEQDTISWFLGDGAGAFIVGEVAQGEGVLGMHTVPTTETCDTFYIENDVSRGTGKNLVMRVKPGSGKIMHETAEPYLRRCCEGAIKRAGVTLKDIDFFIFNTATAWFEKFGARSLGVDPDRTISVFARNGNIGAALMPANLHYAAATRRIKSGDLVLMYGMGSVSAASAAVMRWGDVRLGELPEMTR
jgi:3-oxoacyl-[acyl-carrier-protein] synthase-3